MKNKFSIVKLMLITALLALLAVFTIPAHAQSWPATNAATQTVTGAATYQDTLPTPLNPSAVIARQVSSGILTGTVPVGGITNAGAMVVSFSTNIYTVAPVVVATSSVTNYPVAVTSTTTSNVTFAVLSTNGVAINWHAVGH